MTREVEWPHKFEDQIKLMSNLDYLYRMKIESGCSETVAREWIKEMVEIYRKVEKGNNMQTMCKGRSEDRRTHCKKRTKCARYTAKPSTCQSWFSNLPCDEFDCGYFIFDPGYEVKTTKEAQNG